MMTDVMATESMEKHRKKEHPDVFLPCPSVDPVAKNTQAHSLVYQQLLLSR